MCVVQSLNQLNGTIPSMSKLTYITTFILGHNHLTGTIPDDWAASPTLQLFSIENNNLTGTLPEPGRRDVGGSSSAPFAGFRVEGSGFCGFPSKSGEDLSPG